MAPAELLDLSTVIKVSQALSGEMVQDKLIDRLMRVAIEHAGAERGLLIVPRGDNLQTEAEATIGGEDVTVHLRDGTRTPAALPESLVRYVMRTQQTLMLEDASSQTPFSADPYIVQRRARSILSLPLINQGNVIGILYLENNLTPGVFTPERVAVLKVIASQAGFSLQNTRLYRDLADREWKIRRLVDADILGIFIWNFEGAIVEANQAFLRIVQYDREDLLSGRVRWTDLTPAEWRERDERAVTELKATGTVQPYEKRYSRKDGSHVPVLVGGALFQEDGNEGVAFVLDLSEQKRAEEALRSSEAYLLEAQRLTGTGSWAWSPVAGDIKYWSEECFRVLGFEPAEPLPRFETFFQRIHPDDQAATRKRFQRAVYDKADFEMDYRIVHPDGQTRNIHVVGHPTLGPAGDFREFVGTVIDVTDRLRAEERIRRNERELRTVIDVMPAYVWTSLPDGRVDFLSQSWLDYSGQTRDVAMGWGWASVIHPDDVDRALTNWKAGLASGEPVEQELRCLRLDGVYHWFLNRSLPLRDDGGKIVKWYGILFDVNALKETESALQTREHQLLGIIETIPSMLWSASPTFEPTHLSKRLLEYFGAPFEELINGGWGNFIHPDDREATEKALLRAMSTGESLNVMHRLRRADGEYRWHHARGEALRDPQDKIIQWYGLSVDIDDRKRAEDHLRDTRIKLAKASRFATVAELAGSIAHELNQPLTSVLANAQAAKRWLNAAPPNVTEVTSSIERTIRDARAADERMQHIRALFQRESFVKKDVKIADILNEVVRIVQEDPKKRAIPVECHLEESLPAVLVDQIQIQQVFINLIVNAIEAQEGQQVSPLVVLRAVTASDGMLIQVIDNGPGVEDPDRIFDAFMTTKEYGMGIGLAVSRSIVEAHGGRLWTENNPDGGARFSVALPLSSVNRDPNEALKGSEI